MSFVNAKAPKQTYRIVSCASTEAEVGQSSEGRAGLHLVRAYNDQCYIEHLFLTVALIIWLNILEPCRVDAAARVTRP
jgi:hypothetical protein